MERGKSEIVDGRRSWRRRKVSSRPVLSFAIDSGVEREWMVENAPCSKVVDGEVTLNIKLGGKGLGSMDYSMIV